MGCKQLRVKLFEHLHRLSILHVQAERRGALVSRVTNDITTIQDFMEFGGVGMLIGGAQIVLALVVMFFYQWRLALLVALGIVIYVGLLLLFQRILQKAHDRVREKVADSLSVMGETITGLSVIRAHGVEETAIARVEAALSATGKGRASGQPDVGGACSPRPSYSRRDHRHRDRGRSDAWRCQRNHRRNPARLPLPGESR